MLGHTQYSSPPSVSQELLGVVGDISELQRIDLHSQTALVLFTSLAFLIPAFTAWRMARFWHAFLFAMMTLICSGYHYCSADAGLHLEDHAHHCSPRARHMLTHAFFLWVYYCCLQMAFLVLGPEDPQMQWLGLQSANAGSNVAIPSHAPRDAIISARVVPAVVLFGFHCLHPGWDSEEIHWQSLLVIEILLLLCSVAFWQNQARQAQAADVLVRFKFWHRLLHHGFIPAMMLFWSFCIIGFAEFQMLHSIWHVVVACFAVSLLRTVLSGDSTSPSAKVFDLSLNNPNVAHVLLGSVALIVLPAAVIGASFDWCGTGEPQWPTISLATLCQPGGYFVAIVSVPTCASIVAVFWIVDSTSPAKIYSLQCGQYHTLKSWESQETVLDPEQLTMGKRLGCALGYAGALWGLLASLIMKGSPIQNVLNLFCSIMALGLIMIAMALTVLSSDRSSGSFRFRRCFTLFVCLPLMVLYMMQILLDKCLPGHSQPHYLYMLTEYLVIFLLAAWPLAWAEDVQDTWQRNTSITFAWPKTPWRFV